MIDLAALSFMLFNATPQMQVMMIDAFVEREVRWQYFRRPRRTELVITQQLGDCTDKAILKCNLLEQQNISCDLVHGWAWSGKRWIKHDYYSYDLGTGRQFVDEHSVYVGEGIW